MMAPSIKDRAREELRRYAIVAAYLYICFFVLMLHQSILLGKAGAGLLPHGLAAVKALVLGKFILIGEAVGAGTRLNVSTLAQRIAVRSLLLLVVLVVLTIVEELIVGRVHGKPFTTTLAEYEQRSVLSILSGCLVMLLIMVPLVTASEVSRALGPRVLDRLLFNRAEQQKEQESHDS